MQDVFWLGFEKQASRLAKWIRETKEVHPFLDLERIRGSGLKFTKANPGAPSAEKVVSKSRHFFKKPISNASHGKRVRDLEPWDIKERKKVHKKEPKSGFGAWEEKHQGRVPAPATKKRQSSTKVETEAPQKPSIKGESVDSYLARGGSIAKFNAGLGREDQLVRHMRETLGNEETRRRLKGQEGGGTSFGRMFHDRKAS